MPISVLRFFCVLFPLCVATEIKTAAPRPKECEPMTTDAAAAAAACHDAGADAGAGGDCCH